MTQVDVVTSRTLQRPRVAPAVAIDMSFYHVAKSQVDICGCAVNPQAGPSAAMQLWRAAVEGTHR